MPNLWEILHHSTERGDDALAVGEGLKFVRVCEGDCSASNECDEEVEHAEGGDPDGFFGLGGDAGA